MILHLFKDKVKTKEKLFTFKNNYMREKHLTSDEGKGRCGFLPDFSLQS
jgi:hypothetical protein